MDWLGTKNQIDAASALGNGTHVVILSRMENTRGDARLDQMEQRRVSDGIDVDVIGLMQVAPVVLATLQRAQSDSRSPYA